MLSLSILFIILLCCSAFFSGSETALFSLSGVQLHKLKERHGQSANMLVESLRRPRDMLVTILLGNEFVNVAISIIGAAIINQLFNGSVEFKSFIAVLIVTSLVLVFGDIIPKNISIRFAAVFAPVMIWPLRIFYVIVAPIRCALSWIADNVISFLGGRPESSEPMIMEDEFKKLVDLGRKEGVIVEEERELIHNVFEFTDKVVGDIMTPGEDIFSLSIDASYDHILEEIKSVQYSRVPFYEGEKDNIIGILHVRDIFAFHRKKSAQGGDIRTILREPLFTDRSTPLETLLQEFQRTQLHMAIVKSEGGQLSGVATMDDVLEELFGELE